MMDAPGDSATWATLLPDDTTWLSDHRKLAAGHRLHRAMADFPSGSCQAIVASPWAFTRSRRDKPGVRRTYVAFPSCQKPILVASRDAVVLRYIADSVLSVPPGTGRFSSMLMTACLRLFRLRATWTIAALLRVAGVVLVEWP
jgi:hypothetical protein